MSKNKTRDEIEDKYKWDLSVLYESDECWEGDYKKLETQLSQLLEFKGFLSESRKLDQFMRTYIDFSIVKENLYVYANVRFFEDTGNTTYEEMKGRIELLVSKISSETVFIKKELSSLSEEDIEKIINENSQLSGYRFFLDGYARYRPHILSEESEKVLAELGIALGKPDDIFSAFNDNNISFELFEHNGKEVHLSHAKYAQILESPDRELRQKAFEYYYKPFLQNIDVLANTYATTVLTNIKLTKIRHYKSMLESALFPDYLPTTVFTNLVEVAKENIDVISDFNSLKREALGVKELHFYDNYIPLVPDVDKEYSYEETIDLVRTALQPLGSEYIEKYDATVNARVIDVFESVGKRSGAFSWGSYASRGLVFLNHTGKFSDVSTFAHEFGHCLHRDYSIQNQPFIYYQNPIFLAEIASTFNEALLFDHMSKIADSLEEKKFFLYHNMKRIEATFFRQTMFASFEKEIHVMAESGQVLIAKSITDIYRKNLEAYLGEGMVIDEQLHCEWARIPHFYNAFYVYKYATSLSAAIALAERVSSFEEGAVEDYLKFLGAGSHKEPLEILKDAGVDLTGKKVYEVTINKFRKLLEEYKSL
ncbi:oligopeptidase PepF [Candidatus Scalindua japonica]|uniref:Oligopeptidase F n=1 Tax=Candidatus Scalindua japonica TaxID=1284222 RepID=A0A286U2P4_9BACT|nr:oligoendopeptidase F [Candidatus Scalindua japonica]GAX62396.1 oligopeptidase PepF [Candidatus Scalindua japonica]